MTIAAPRMTERQLQDAIVHLARVTGWLTYHTWLSARSAKGFPDLVLVRAGRCCVVECKSATGKVSAAQETWLGALGGVPGIEVFVWRPDDWHQGRIDTVLA